MRAGYDALRHQALSGLRGAGWAVPGWCVGAWVAACAACPPRRPLPGGPPPLGGARLPPGLHTEVALLLAGMVLPVGREERR